MTYQAWVAAAPGAPFQKQSLERPSLGPEEVERTMGVLVKYEDDATRLQNSTPDLLRRIQRRLAGGGNENAAWQRP